MRTFILALFILGSFSLNAKQPEESKKFYKELNKFYDAENINLSKIESLSCDNDIIYKVPISENEYDIVVLTTARGRHDFFDYLIIYGSNLEIKLIKVLVYRSDYGSEITAKRWLKQFYTKKEDSLKYGSDIQAISGATFSAMSLTKNVNRINKKLKKYFNQTE